MSSYVFDQVKLFAIKGELQLEMPMDGMYIVALLDATILNTPSFSKKTKWDEISQYEIPVSSNPGYILGGKEITGVGSSTYIDNGTNTGDDNHNDIIVYADNVVFNSSHITASCAVIMKYPSLGAMSTRSNTDLDLIAALDLRNGVTPVTSSNGAFRLLFEESSGGFLKIK